jgi:sporulation integral membrane protein YtvI
MKIKKNWIRLLIFIIAVAAAAALVYLFLPKILGVVAFAVKLFLPFILGYLFSLAVNPLADLLQKRLKIPRGLSAVLVIVLIIGIFGGIITFAIWKIIDEIRMLYVQFPIIYESVRISIHHAGEKWSIVYTSMPSNVQDALSELGTAISDKAAELINTKSMPMVGYASDFAKAIPSVFVAVIVFLLSSYFMVSENKAVAKALHSVFRHKTSEKLRLVKQELKKYLGGYLKAQGILMLLSFVVMFIGFCILNINYALIIALAIAIIDALPFFGSGLVLWPWAAVELINGNIKLGVALVIIYIAVMLLRRFAEPKLVSSRAGMNPLLTLISMYVGYKTLSIGGLILGPIILMIIISFYKAGLFEAPARFIKRIGKAVKEQCILFKQFVVNLIGSDWNE